LSDILDYAYVYCPDIGAIDLTKYMKKECEPVQQLQLSLLCQQHRSNSRCLGK